METEELKELITQQLKVQLQKELLIRRASRAYDGTVKPVGKTFPTAYGNRVTTGRLFKSINVSFVESPEQDPKIQIAFPGAPEWYWVNYGRRGKKQDRNLRYPPLDVIETWVRAKGVLPFKTKDGDIMDSRQQAFAIRASIGEYGTAPTDFVQQAVKKTEMKLVRQLTEYSAEYVRNVLSEFIIKNNELTR